MDAISGLVAGSGKYEAMDVNGRAARSKNIDEDSPATWCRNRIDGRNGALMRNVTLKCGNVFHPQIPHPSEPTCRRSAVKSALIRSGSPLECVS
jgi:hypothetical protein